MNGVSETPRPAASTSKARTTGEGKRRQSRRGHAAPVRYFLRQPGESGEMVLGEEIASEAEALIAAFRSGGTFVSVTEWRAVVDSGGRGGPRIHKELIGSHS